MPLKEEDVKEIPLVYPLIAIRLRTVAWINGRGIDSECEEVINMDQLTPKQAAAAVVRLLGDFEGYVSKVVETANSPAGQRELQNILDTHARPEPLPSADPPSSPSQATDQGAGTAPSDPPAA